jgi:predicted Zn-dependent protease
MAAVPSYTSNVFTPADVAVIRLGLHYQWRIDAAKTSADIARERVEWRKEMLRLVEGARDPGWEASSRADALAFLREGAPTTLTRLSSSDVDSYNSAANAANKHDYAAAWQAIETLAARYPTELPVQTLACYIAFWRDKTSAQTVQQCQRASQVDSRAVKPLFMLATALLDTHSDSEAGPVLAELDKRIERQDASSDDWVTLAQLHQVHSDVTLALRAVQRSRDTGAIATYERWAQKQRHLSSLPKEAERCGILPTNENEYVITTRAAYKAFYAQDTKNVEALARLLATNFPKAPGAAVLRCALAQSRSNLTEAEKQCLEALTIDPDTAMAHYWLALVQISKKNTNQAIDELQKAIDIYPQLKDAWQTLGRVLKQLKKKMQLTELGIRYQNEFNEALDIP